MLESGWGFETGGLTLVETQDGDGSAFTPAATTIPAGYREVISTVRGFGYDSIAFSRYTGATSVVAGSAEEQWCNLEMRIPRYSNTDAYKWLSARGAWWNATPSQVYQESVFLTWENTDAITSVQLTWNNAGAMLSAGSAFSVWVR